jgi:HEAT repeat protein
MGLFDLFKSKDAGSGDEKELVRLQKMVANKLSQNVDREDALIRLGEMKTPQAARVLLTRFNWTLNPSIKDQEEKEIAVRGIAAAGMGAAEVIRNYCIRAETLTWPLKALRQIVGEESFESELLSLLDAFDTDYMRDPAPKVQLMQALSEFRSDDVRVAVQPFLMDLSEEVRFAAVATVLSCDNAAEAAETLVSAVIEEESLRVKNRIINGMVEHGIKVPADLMEKLRPACPPGFHLGADGSLSGKPAA